MKKLLTIITILAVGLGSALAQGTVDFKNLGVGLDQKVFNVNGTTPLDTGFTIELLGGTTNQALGSLIPFATTTISGGYFFGGTQAITNVAAGSVAQIIIRAWQTAAGSFASSTIRGQTNFSVITGGVGSPPSAPATFSAANDPVFGRGFTSFSVMAVVVPEPSVVALGMLGAAALLLRRRR